MRLLFLMIIFLHLLPLNAAEQAFVEIEPDEPTVFYCETVANAALADKKNIVWNKILTGVANGAIWVVPIGGAGFGVGALGFALSGHGFVAIMYGGGAAAAVGAGEAKLFENFDGTPLLDKSEKILMLQELMKYSQITEESLKQAYYETSVKNAIAYEESRRQRSGFAPLTEAEKDVIRKNTDYGYFPYTIIERLKRTMGEGTTYDEARELVLAQASTDFLCPLKKNGKHKFYGWNKLTKKLLPTK